MAASALFFFNFIMFYSSKHNKRKKNQQFKIPLSSLSVCVWISEEKYHHENFISILYDGKLFLIIIIQLVIALDLREYLSVDFIVVFARFFRTWDCVYMIKWPMTLIWLKYQINASTLAHTRKKNEIPLLSHFIFARNVDINHSQIHSSKNISKKSLLYFDYYAFTKHTHNDDV